MKQKTSLIIDAMHNSMKRRKSQVGPDDKIDVNADMSEETDPNEEDEMKDSMPDLPPVQIEAFGRRGRRNTITVHRSSLIPENIPEISESCIRYIALLFLVKVRGAILPVFNNLKSKD